MLTRGTRLFSFAFHAAIVAGLMTFALGCAAKKLPPLVFPLSLYPAESYPIHTNMGGLVVALVPYVPGVGLNIDPRQPLVMPEDVPFNLLQSGVLPIRVIFTNRRDGELVIDPSQLFCLSNDTPYMTYPPQQAIHMVVKSEVFKEALKGTSVGPLLRSIAGGELLMSAATGGVGGVASGGISGGASGVAKGATKTALARANQYEEALTQLLYDQANMRALKPHTLLPGFTTDGVVYCPGTVAIRAIHLTAYDRTNEESIALFCPLPEATTPASFPEDDD